VALLIFGDQDGDRLTVGPLVERPNDRSASGRLDFLGAERAGEMRT